MQLWEQLALGAMALLIMFFFFPGVKNMLEKSKNAPKDWSGFLIPIAVMVGLIIFVIIILRS